MEGVDAHGARAQGADHGLGGTRAPGGEEVADDHGTVDGKPEGRVPLQRLHSALQVAAMKLEDLALVIGEAEVQVDVGHQVDGPFAARREHMLRRLALDGHARRRRADKLGDRHRGDQFPEIPAVVGQRQLVYVLAHPDRRRSGGRRSGGRRSGGRRSGGCRPPKGRRQAQHLQDGVTSQVPGAAHQTCRDRRHRRAACPAQDDGVPGDPATEPRSVERVARRVRQRAPVVAVVAVAVIVTQRRAHRDHVGTRPQPGGGQDNRQRDVPGDRALPEHLGAVAAHDVGAEGPQVAVDTDLDVRARTVAGVKTKQ